MEIARCLMGLKQYQEAMDAIDSLGKRLGNGTGRVLAAECAGDLMVRMQACARMYRKSVKWYGFALKVLASIRPEKTDGSYRRFYTAEQKIVRARIEKKIADVKRLLEIELFGKGWVLFRDAEYVRRERRDYVRAYLLHERLRAEFPKTVYAEAATCYGIKCLLRLADEKTAGRARDAVVGLEKSLSEERRRVARLKHAGAPGTVIKEAREKIEREMRRIKRMKSVPTGRAAARLARRRTEEFIRRNRFGLYRGEAMASMARAYLIIMADFKRGFAWYDRLYEWVHQVSLINSPPEAYQVPDRAKTAARPPESEKHPEGWNGYPVKTRIPVGSIVNRLNCSWYLDSLWAESAKLLSFRAFLSGDRDRAMALLRTGKRHDRPEAKLRARGLPDCYARLAYDYENGILDLPGYHVDLFKNNLRRVMLLGDFYYELEDEERCIEVRRRLADGAYGKLSREQAAAAKYRLAGILFRMFRLDDAKAVLEDILRNHSGTGAEGWACIGLGNILIMETDPKKRARCVGYYRRAVKTQLKKSEKEQALFYLARALDATGQQEEALKTFEKVLKCYPNGGYSTESKKEIAALRKHMRKGGKQ